MRTLALALLLLAATACDDPATRAQLGAVKSEWDDTTREMAELGHELGDLAKLGASKLMVTVNEQLTELDGHMANLKTQAAQLSAQARTQYDAAMGQVDAQRTALAARLKELSTEGADASVELREGVAAAYAELAQALTRARAAFDGAPASLPTSDG